MHFDFERAQSACGELLKTASRRYSFPWTGLEDDVMQTSDGRLHLLGYGSLLNPESARRTIPDTPPNGHPPVLAFGAQRIFNYIMPDAVFIDRGEELPTVERAALNVQWTGRVSDVLNGRLLDIPPSDFDKLRVREEGYHLDPVACVAWSALDSEPQIAYVLRADSTPWRGRTVVSSEILPNLSYVVRCRAGARLVDSMFEQLFLTTSWLADGATRLDSYLASRQ